MYSVARLVEITDNIRKEYPDQFLIEASQKFGSEEDYKAFGLSEYYISYLKELHERKWHWAFGFVDELRKNQQHIVNSVAKDQDLDAAKPHETDVLWIGSWELDSIREEIAICMLKSKAYNSIDEQAYFFYRLDELGSLYQMSLLTEKDFQEEDSDLQLMTLTELLTFIINRNQDDNPSDTSE